MADHIQIGNVSPRKQYAADGIQTLFTFPFPIFKEEDLQVFLDDTLQGSGYTVAGAGNDLGGQVTFDTAPGIGVSVTLRRRLTIARQSDFQESGAFRARVINDELDFLTAALQRVAEDTLRSLQLSPTDPDAALILPARATRSGSFLAFDAEGNPMAAAGPMSELPLSTFMATVIDDTDAAAARASLSAQENLGLSPASAGNAGAVVSVSTGGGLQYDPSLAHGAHLAALSHGY